eukprot:6106258-Pyramimonas_sp.AAC.2
MGPAVSSRANASEATSPLSAPFGAVREAGPKLQQLVPRPLHAPGEQISRTTSPTPWVRRMSPPRAIAKKHTRAPAQEAHKKI